MSHVYVWAVWNKTFSMKIRSKTWKCLKCMPLYWLSLLYHSASYMAVHNCIHEQRKILCIKNSNRLITITAYLHLHFYCKNSIIIKLTFIRRKLKKNPCKNAKCSLHAACISCSVRSLHRTASPEPLYDPCSAPQLHLQRDNNVRVTDFFKS
jgi:hypothetical protein